MVIHFLYCIDFPNSAENKTQSDRVDGWLLCSHKIIAAKMSAAAGQNAHLEYGILREDVALHFRDFPNDAQCGFRITAGDVPVNLREKAPVEFALVNGEGVSKIVHVALDLTSSVIQDIEVDDDESLFDERYRITEETLVSTLSQHPWLTIRMDITNKCNLRCIMCHYKEKEIYSQPAKNITADQLRLYLKDIGPFVKHIMLSCGFEPLMSKHFPEIIQMLRENYPHMEIGMCTNGMLLDAKARKIIIENNITHVILSFDGVTKNTLERIRVGASYDKIIGNIMALRDLKIKHNRRFPLLFMDFVMMNSNIHEAPAFVELCARLGMGMIDFRHMVGNIYFADHEEMLVNHKVKYNHYRQRILEESKKFNMDVRLPEAFEDAAALMNEATAEAGLSDFAAVSPDAQTEPVVPGREIVIEAGVEANFAFLSEATCLRPFNEIMIVDQQKILPCSYYSDAMGHLDETDTLFSVFFNEKFRKVRRKKLFSRFDHNCLNCPIKLNLLPTELAH